MQKSMQESKSFGLSPFHSIPLGGNANEVCESIGIVQKSLGRDGRALVITLKVLGEGIAKKMKSIF